MDDGPRESLVACENDQLTFDSERVGSAAPSGFLKPVEEIHQRMPRKLASAIAKPLWMIFE